MPYELNGAHGTRETIYKPECPTFAGSIHHPRTMRVQLLLLVAALTAETTATGSDASSSSSFLDDVLRYVYRCRTSDWHECVERDLTRTVDAVMAAKNDTYRLNQYLTVTVAAAQETGNDTVARARNDGLVPRIVDLFNALRVRYQPEERTADDDVFEGTNPGARH